MRRGGGGRRRREKEEEEKESINEEVPNELSPWCGKRTIVVKGSPGPTGIINPDL